MSHERRVAVASSCDRCSIAWAERSSPGSSARAADTGRICDRSSSKNTRRGRDLHAALRFMAPAMRDAARLGVALYQAPIKTTGLAGPAYGRTFADILESTGFGDVDELEMLVGAWRRLFDLIGPDRHVADYSPLALLAARGRGLETIVLGNGFFLPPNAEPLPDFAPELGPDPRLHDAEPRVLDRCNRVLRRLGGPPLTRLADLMHGDRYAPHDTRLLTRIEFDHYPDRIALQNASGIPTSPEIYLGCVPHPPGSPPEWPRGKGPIAWAYLDLHGTPNVAALFELLEDQGVRTLVRASDADRRLIEHYASPRIVFTDHPVSLESVAEQADLAITNGSTTLTETLYRLGVLQLNLPFHTEHRITAQRLEALGAGRWAPPEAPALVGARLATMLGGD